MWWSNKQKETTTPLKDPHQQEQAHNSSGRRLHRHSGRRRRKDQDNNDPSSSTSNPNDSDGDVQQQQQNHRSMGAAATQETNAGFEVSLPTHAAAAAATTVASPPAPENFRGFVGAFRSKRKSKDRYHVTAAASLASSVNKMRSSPRTVAADASSSSASTSREKATSETAAAAQPRHPFGSVSHVLAERSKVHRTQYSLLDAASNTAKDKNSKPAAVVAGTAHTWESFRPRNHRVPLWFGTEHDGNTMMAAPPQHPPLQLSFSDAASLLRSRDVSSELQCLTEEIEHLDAEISFLLQDRTDIENQAAQLFHNHTFPPASSSLMNHDKKERMLLKRSEERDHHRQLLKHDKSLNYVEKLALRQERGTCLTVSTLRNGDSKDDALRDALLKVCNSKSATSSPSQQQQQRGGFSPSQQHGNQDYLTIRPQDCRGEDGAATTIQHVCLLKSNNSNNNGTSPKNTNTNGPHVFVSRDQGNPYYSGPLPVGLARRMAHADNEADNSSSYNNRTTASSRADDLHYLAVGPLDSYYAEFRSGECLWAVFDDDLNALLQEWEHVSRVALGPCTTTVVGNDTSSSLMLNGGGQSSHSSASTMVASWVVTTRDGRVAWKNVPSRLHQILEQRVASETAPMEVSLGYGGSYFVRFLDGTVDYCLPAHMSTVMEQVIAEQQPPGSSPLDDSFTTSAAVVTSVFLHPELPRDFVIRHTCAGE